MNYKLISLVGIATIATILVYAFNQYNSNNYNTHVVCSNDKEPLEQFRQTHLREYYVINGPISELVEYPLDYMARSAKYIIIGTSVTEGTEYKAGMNYPKIYAIVNVEQDLAGNFKGNEITITSGRLACHFAGIYYGDRILVFVRELDKDSLLYSAYGNVNFLYGIWGIYKIVDGKAYGYYYDGIPLDDLIKIIQDARADRIKDLAVNSDYAIVGRIKGIERVSTSPDITEVDEHTLTTNVTVEVYNAMPSYKGKEFTFFVDIDVIQDCKDRICLFFIRHGTHEDELYKHLPYERLSKLAEYYISNNDSVYIIMDDGKVYGKEYPEGIVLDELLARIRMFKGIG